MFLCGPDILQETREIMKERLFETMLAGFGIMVTLMLAGFGLMLTLQMFTMSQMNDIDRRVAHMEGMNSFRERCVAKQIEE
jgi:hypothetical protein